MFLGLTPVVCQDDKPTITNSMIDKPCDFASRSTSRGPKLIACGLSRFVPAPKDSRESQKALGVRGFSCPLFLRTSEFVESSEIYAIGMTVLQNHGCNQPRQKSERLWAIFGTKKHYYMQ